MFGVAEVSGWCLGLSIFLSCHDPFSPHERPTLGEPTGRFCPQCINTNHYKSGKCQRRLANRKWIYNRDKTSPPPKKYTDFCEQIRPSKCLSTACLCVNGCKLDWPSNAVHCSKTPQNRLPICWHVCPTIFSILAWDEHLGLCVPAGVSWTLPRASVQSYPEIMWRWKPRTTSFSPNTWPTTHNNKNR